MQLKIKTLLIIVFNLLVIHIHAQDKPVLLNGKVKYNSLNLRDINVINRTSKIGTASNDNGEFAISAKKGDSIEFSSIEYLHRTILITDTHIQNKEITVYLEPGFNELDEVEILQKMRFDWSKAPVQQRTVLDIDEVSQSKAPDTDKYLNQGYMTNGMNLVGIYNLLTKNSRARKRSENDEKNLIAHFKSELPDTLKKLYGTDFFTDWLYIPKNEVDLFLDYCQENGLGDYYNSNEFVVKNFLVIQSNQYLKLKN
ncbi:hypothetical protein EC396_16835 [Lutibacter sp. HS1-25]|uniref:hypothetical protein n=1 Tax=Lutibacter sp. HS1-25 TaxID=2485000 RepID=UPI001011AB4B|nr:hypothetical protein [Lutibacter sp. HS1-25]RXP44824.1 hypothetical protein EC396_16835 [Lutibacter sp. HS1-25]